MIVGNLLLVLLVAIAVANGAPPLGWVVVPLTIFACAWWYLGMVWLLPLLRRRAKEREQRRQRD